MEDEKEFKVARKKKNNDLNKLLIKAKDDPNAQFQLGAKYYNGKDVEQNYEEAIKWFTLSANTGNAKAQYNLAVMYENGEGVKENLEEALKWYKKAAKQGNEDAKEALKELGIEEIEEKPIISNENKKTESIPQDTDKKEDDKEKAVSLYKKGAKYYSQTEPDYALAFKYFMKSAKLGYALAQYNLATMYEDGNYVEEDIQKAIKWYKKAAKQGDEDAKEALKELLESDEIKEDEPEETNISDEEEILCDEEPSNNDEDEIDQDKIESEFLNLNEKDSLKTITEIKEIADKCQKIYTKKEIANLEFANNLENLSEKIEDIRTGDNVKGSLNTIIGILYFIVIIIVAVIGIKMGFGSKFLEIVGGIAFLGAIIAKILIEVIFFIYKLFNRKNMEKNAETYGETQIKKHNDKLEQIYEELKEAIQKENEKYATDIFIEKLFNNLPYLYYLHFAITSKKAKTLKDAIDLYKSNKIKIEEKKEEFEETKTSFVKTAIDMKNGEYIPGTEKPVVTFFLFWGFLGIGVLILITVLAGYGLFEVPTWGCLILFISILFIIIGLISKFILKTFFKEQCNQNAENYMKKYFYPYLYESQECM